MTKSPLKPLHSNSALIASKIDQFERLSTEDLVAPLQPGRSGSLKTRPDGTVMDGHHRLKVLRDRGIDIDTLPREVIPKDTAAE